MLASEKSLTTPYLNLPEQAYDPLVNAIAPGAAYIPGVSRLAKNQVEGMTSIGGAAQIPWMIAGGVEGAALKGTGMAGKVLAGLFGVQGAEGLIQAVPETVRAAQRGDVAGTVEGIGNTALSGLMVLGGGMALKMRGKGAGTLHKFRG